MSMFTLLFYFTLLDLALRCITLTRSPFLSPFKRRSHVSA